MGAPELLALSLGLSVVVAALGWVGGRGVERLSADPRLRDRVWAAALILPALPPVALGLMLLTPAPVREIAAAPIGLPIDVVMAPAGVAAVAPPTGPVLDSNLFAWIVLGVAILLAVGRLTALALRARRLLRIIAQAQTPAPAVTAMVEDVARDLAIHPPLVGISAAAPEALLAGLGRAQLILPAGLATPSTDLAAARAVIAHELSHLKRGDHRALWLEEALLALLAVNPLMAMLRAHRAAAREEACDALALAGAAPDARRAYARSLIEALRSRAAPPASGGLPALTFTGAGRTTAMHRLKAVMNPAPAAGRGPRLMALGLAGLIALLGGAGSLAVAGEREAVIRMAAPAPEPTPAREPIGEQSSSVERDGGASSSVVDAPTDRPASQAVETTQSRLTPEQEARYRNASARQYQTICASAEPADVGFCSGVMFGVLVQAPQNGFCAPGAVAAPGASGPELSAFVDSGKREIAGMRPNAGEGAYEFAQRALKQAYPCETARMEPEALQAEVARMQSSVPLTVTADIEGRPLSVRGDETLRVVLTDENGAVMNTFGTLNPGKRASGPLGPLGMAIAAEDFPGFGESTRTYTLTGEIRGPGRALRYVADPVTIRLAPGARHVDLRPTLSFRPA
ncbi:M56 family metallopeptidase [Brevundimonas sp.]|uniref:M56 family metallopeptidase n=1 Tax=Brevundimonas sp. TaxID=1871086 RepID=UPI002FCAFDF1